MTPEERPDGEPARAIRRPLVLLLVAVASLALSVALRSGDGQDPWAALLAFAAAMLGGVSLLVGFYSAAFLAGGQKVAWPMAVYVVTIISATATFLVWVTVTSPPRHGETTSRSRPAAHGPASAR